MATDLIEILLATYNAEKYLSSQLDSIIGQSFKNWKIIIRDDNSEDSTVEIINNFRKKYPEKILIINDTKQNLGVCGNFSELLKNSHSDYVMFCDQDDIWLKYKIEITFQKMKDMENKFGSKCPILVHTDLVVVDKNLKKISNSFWKFSHLNPETQKKIQRLLIQNFVTGCTIMINRELKNISPIVPDDAFCHDSWLALVACAFGKIKSVPIPTVLYRQHQKNVFGGKKWNHFTFLLNAISTIIDQRMFEVIKEEKKQTRRLYNQAKSFYNYYSKKLDNKQSRIVLNFSNMESCNLVDRRLKLLRYGFFKPGIARNLKLLLYV